MTGKDVGLLVRGRARRETRHRPGMSTSGRCSKPPRGHAQRPIARDLGRAPQVNRGPACPARQVQCPARRTQVWVTGMR